MQFGCTSQLMGRLPQCNLASAAPLALLTLFRNGSAVALDSNSKHLIAHAGGRNGD